MLARCLSNSSPSHPNALVHMLHTYTGGPRDRNTRLCRIILALSSSGVSCTGERFTIVSQALAVKKQTRPRNKKVHEPSGQAVGFTQVVWYPPHGSSYLSVLSCFAILMCFCLFIFEMGDKSHLQRSYHPGYTSFVLIILIQFRYVDWHGPSPS